jgi:hypothetical protein
VPVKRMGSLGFWDVESIVVIRCTNLSSGSFKIYSAFPTDI